MSVASGLSLLNNPGRRRGREMIEDLIDDRGRPRPAGWLATRREKRRSPKTWVSRIGAHAGSADRSGNGVGVLDR
jgi:hypothetical protein